MQSAQSIWTLIRAAGEPYPGAYCYYKGKRVVIWEADLVGPGPFWGLPGQIQRVDESGALVQAADRQHILIRRIAIDGRDVSPREILRNHDKFSTEP